jgi:hypothetical protein
MSSKNRMILLFIDKLAAHPKDSSYLQNMKVVLYHPNCTGILHLLDLRITRYFKYCYHIWLVRKSVSVIDHKLLYDAPLVGLNVWTCVSLWNHGAVTHTTSVNYCQKCGFNLNQSSDIEDVTELSILKDD